MQEGYDVFGFGGEGVEFGGFAIKESDNLGLLFSGARENNNAAA